MNLRPTALVLAAAALATGCVVTPGHHTSSHTTYEHRTYHASDAYEGYYYVRIVYFNGVPWYVDDDLRARPVPRHLHAHYRNTSWTRSLPPRFIDHDEVRDGYRVSRIIYINGVPHHVDDGRQVRPLPRTVRNRFDYRTVAVRPAVPVPAREQRMTPPPAREMSPPGRPAFVEEVRGPQRDDGRGRPERFEERNLPPAAYRERDRERDRDLERIEYRDAGGPPRGHQMERVQDVRRPGRPDNRYESAPPAREMRNERVREVRQSEDVRPQQEYVSPRGRGAMPPGRGPAAQQETVRETVHERGREQVREREQVRQRDARPAPQGSARKKAKDDEDDARDERETERGNGRGNDARRGNGR